MKHETHTLNINDTFDNGEVCVYQCIDNMRYHMKASEPKWVNPVLNIIAVNSLRLGDLHITIQGTANSMWYESIKIWNNLSYEKTIKMYTVNEI